MRVGDVCTRPVVHRSRNASALEAAKLMRDDHIGNAVVVDEDDGRKVPLASSPIVMSSAFGSA